MRSLGLAPIHDRMPCMLPLERFANWQAADTPDKGANVLQPVPEDFVLEHPVSDRANNVRNEGPQLILPAPASPVQTDFFQLTQVKLQPMVCLSCSCAVFQGQCSLPVGNPVPRSTSCSNLAEPLS